MFRHRSARNSYRLELCRNVKYYPSTSRHFKILFGSYMVRNDHLPGGPVIAHIIIFYINATKIGTGRPVCV